MLTAQATTDQTEECIDGNTDQNTAIKINGEELEVEKDLHI